MKYWLPMISIFFVIIFLLVSLISTERQLDDCRFEVNHLQTKMYRLQELSDYIPAMEQILPPLVLAQLKVATLMIRNERHRVYEGVEQPLLTEKERNQCESLIP